MDKKSIRNIIGLFSCIIILGCLSTFITKSVIGSRRNDLYASLSDGTEQTSETTTEPPTSSNINETTGINGPISSTVSEEKYLSDIKLLEEQIAEVWANVTESNSELSAAKYEKGVWDEQLSKIYELYLDDQSSDNAAKLRQEQSSFETERERSAITAAKNANEALDGLTYNKEYVRLTKEKTYEYIERYFLED